MTRHVLSFGDLGRLKLVSEPRLAPDGLLAFVQEWLDEVADATRREIVVLDPQSQQQPWRDDDADDERTERRRRADAGTRTGEKQAAISARVADAWCPRWSPDGGRLALISSASGSAQPALWQPSSSALHRLAAVPGEVAELAWSPDGSTLAVTCVLRRVVGSGPAFVQPSGQARLDGVAGLAAESRRIFLLGTDGSPGWDLLAGPGQAWHPRWSPDGSRLAFLARLPGDTGLPGPVQLCLTDPSGPAAPGQICRLAGSAVAFTWSPLGRDLAYLGPRDREQADIDCRLFRCPADGAAPSTELATTWDRSLGSIVRADDARAGGPPPLLWSAVTDRIYFPVADGGRGNIGWAAAHGGEHGVLLGGHRACLDPSLDPAGRTIAFVSTDASDPGNIYLADLDGSDERQLTDVNGWLGHLRQAPTRLVTATGPDGTPIESWLTVPDPVADAAGPQPCPLVVSIHGGPHYPVGWRFNFEAQRLAARGYAVLSANPRGSGGYGRDFAAAIRGAWGTSDWADLDRLIDAATALPAVDAGRVAVTGVSYGGYLTMRAITQSARFRAAISENGVSNLLALWGSGAEDVGWLSAEMGATPWQRPDIYVSASPLAQAGSISTPLLLIHAELDQNCPISQSEQMLVALRERGRAVELLRLDGEGHLINLVGRPSRRLARASAVDQWLDRHLRPEPPADGEEQ
jgi:dipeptidyl aminopeptidase/acylaminoacyl peptidase